MDIIKEYSDFCSEHSIDFKINDKILSYDDTTLFCPAGMQQFKSKFKDQNITGITTANIQSCLRLLDIDNIGDGTHLLYFDMMGLFSFRSMTVKQAIDFWMQFLDRLNIKPEYITIHPDKEDWKSYYSNYNIEIKYDLECIWSDGELSGYCTEFYYKGVEIGNIVNICGDCIDVGFGLQRLDAFVNGTSKQSDVDILRLTIQKILNDGVVPGNKQHGYVLRKLMRALWKKGGSIENTHFSQEVERQERVMRKYDRLKDKYKDKPKEWWFDTHGIDLDLVK